MAFDKQVRAALDDLMAGRVTAMSCVYDPTGIGRVSVTTVDGVNVDLLEFDMSDVDPGPITADTAPGKVKK
jgi:hypothetical protein